MTFFSLKRDPSPPDKGPHESVDEVYWMNWKTKDLIRFWDSASNPENGTRRVGCTALYEHVYMPWKPKGTCCGTSALASSLKEAASRISRNEVPRVPSKTTERTTPSSSPVALGAATKIGSPGEQPST